MKTLKYILLAILLGINLVSCEPPPVNEEVGIDQVEKNASKGDQIIIEGEEDKE